jgi:hypothetical protein
MNPLLNKITADLVVANKSTLLPLWETGTKMRNEAKVKVSTGLAF